MLAQRLHAMKSRTFDGKDGLHTTIDPSSSEAIIDDLALEPNHKIFLSHSGAQKDFVGNLCKALHERCYYTFFDGRSESLPNDTKFPSLICKAVQQCQLFVVVISEDYFMSKWPMIELDALVKAMKETKSNMNKDILPLFYGLSMSELKDEKKRQRWFEKWETFARDDLRGSIRVNDWRYALDELTKFNGLIYDRELKQVEYENKIVSYICKLVTLDIKWEDSHVQGNAHEVVFEKMKQVGVSQLAKVKVVGLYGVGGIGKTTTCKTLCNELSSNFEGRVCHIEFDSTSSNSKGLLQKVLIKLTKKSQDTIQHLNEGECKDVLYGNLWKHKTFLAIDNGLNNADSIKQAMVFLKAPFHQDSLILVIARAQRTLELWGVDGAACLEMPELGQRDATNLFLYYAANGQQFTSEEDMIFIDLCVKRCYFSKGDGRGLYYNPLALEALGRQLGSRGKNPFEWALGHRGKNPSEWAQVVSLLQNLIALLGKEEVSNVLRNSFDLLQPIETFKSQQALVKEISDSDSDSDMKAKAQDMDDYKDLPVFAPLDEWEEPQMQLSHSATTSITVASISLAAPTSVHDQNWDISIDNKSTTVMAEPSSWLSLGREAPTLSSSILLVEEDMPSTGFGKGPSSSTEVPTTDLIVYGMGKLHSYLDIAAQCMVRVQEMPPRKFNNERCGYLVAKFQVILQRATFFLVNAQFNTAEDMTRCTEVFKLLLALALKIESFMKGCCKDEWLQAAMTLTNTAEYVSSLGFNLELCRVYFSTQWTATKALTAAQVDSIDRNEVEIVKRKASLDVDMLLNKVILELPSLQAEDKDLAIYLLQRLKRVGPISASLSPESPFWSAFNDQGFLGRIFQMVRQNEQLGKGTSATVHKALWLGIPVAKKTFDCPEHPDYVREAQILAGLCHPNIMSMFCYGMDKRKCSIVMELMDEDLHSFMQRRLDANPHSPPFSVFEVVDVILQIGEGVRYLHENGIVHRDLKSCNVLVKNILPPDLEVQYVLIKVADFGFAKIKESSTRYSNQTFNIGTNRWMPPEVINLRNFDGQTSASMLEEGPKYPKKSDVYSFGMVCYEILTGDIPFQKEKFHIAIKKKVLKGERPTLPDYCPSILKALIEDCWDPEPTRRPSLASICSSVKHLKCLLMSGFNSNEDSHVEIGEPFQMAPETPHLKFQQEKL